MKSSLKPGLTYRHTFVVPPTKTVPHLYPESDIFRSMPDVLATGFMVGLMEWACVELLRPHLDPGEGSLGISIDVSHEAATPPGHEVTVDATLAAIDGRKLSFDVVAHDERDLIGRGKHGRSIVLWEKFNARVADKTKRS